MGERLRRICKDDETTDLAPQEYLDFFESPEAVNVVLLASEVKQLHAGGNVRVSRAIRNVYNDRRRSCILFDNEHCRRGVGRPPFPVHTTF